jgi:2-dehydropantoate 2-reductase
VNDRADDRASSTAGAPSIALVGPGAIGTTIAALLHAEGHSVVLSGRTPRPSLELRPDDGDPIVVPGPVHTDPTDIAAPVDVVLLAVKDTENAAVAPWLTRLCDADTVVCVLQNGVEQVERVGPLCPESTVLPCAVWFSAETEPQGWVRLRTPVRLALPEGPPSERLAEMLRGPRLSIEADPDFVAVAWHKLLVNAVAGLMVLTGRKAGMFHRADIATLGRAYLAECLAVARGGRRPSGQGDRSGHRHVHRGTGGHHDVDPDRPRARPTVGVGHSQRRHRPQGGRARYRDAHQRRRGAPAGRRQRRARLTPTE